MRFMLKPISIILALAMLSASLAYCQEPPAAPAAVDDPAAGAGPAEPSAVTGTPAPVDSLKAAPQPAAADTGAAAKDQAKKPKSWMPEKVEIDRNGKIFIGASLALLGGVYLAYRMFKKDGN